MSNVVKLSLAVGLALAAAALNAVWLSAEKNPPTFVAAGADMKPGQVITAESLTAVPVPGDAAHLNKSLIPFTSRSTLIGLKTSRGYVQGDMFFQSDIKPPNQLAEYEVLGPFKLITVGSRFTEPTNQDESQSDAGGNTITIAVNSNFDERTRKLLQIVDPARGPNRDRSTRIIAIQVIPKEEQKAAQLVEEKDIVYQAISLDGITNIPRVLLAGDVIRFVVPADSF
jgi:hypothetical protein